jgi:hypothetical protein
VAGGAKAATLYNCLLTENSADEGGGGGAEGGTLYNCVLIGNWALDGGGVNGGLLFGCAVVSNSASKGGGVAGAFTPGGPAYGILNNCVVFYNTATNGPNFGDLCLLDHCCTEPLPSEGTGNINAPPLFRDGQNGDFRLSASSPCIDAGRNLMGFTMTLPPIGPLGSLVVAYNYEPTDMLGNTRFIDGNGDGVVAWDIGAYEFNSFKPPRFTGLPQLTAEGWKFTIAGPTNKWIGLQRSSDFTGWLDLLPPGLTGEDGVCHVTDADTGPKMMFYRAIVLP